MSRSSSSHEHLQEIFLNVIELESPEEKAAYLAEACGADETMRSHLEALLQAHEEDNESQTSTSLTSEKPGGIIGRYKLLEKIGEGGFGTVYMADQTEPVVRRVALKIIKLGMDTKEVIARFEAERQALALMDDPNIAKVFDAGATESGRPYFVMELVKGIPITAFCDDRQLDTSQRLAIFLDVCSAVQHAHQKGIIHRDLKPSNILVTLHGDKPVPKVIDFGIAKATQQRLTDKTLFTRFEQFIGTPVYMSPEQAVLSGLDIDTRSDIYALGILLYELLTGKPPFDAKSLLSAGYDEMRRIIREVEPPKPSARLSTLLGEERTSIAKEHHADLEKLGRLVRGDLDWIVMKAIEKDRPRRYGTANALAMDIRRHLNDEPVLAAAPSVSYRIGKFVRRNRSAVSAAVAIGLLLVSGIAISASLAVAATKAKNREAKARAELHDQLGMTIKAQQEAEDQRIRAVDTVQRLQIKQAESLMQSGHTRLALAHLAQVVRDYPTNQVAAYGLIDLLVNHPFPQLVCEPMAHDAVITSAELSPNGQHVVTASGTAARVWSTTNGRLIGEPMLHPNKVLFAQFSPDGLRLVTTARDHTARLWEARSGQPLGEPMQHAAQITSAQFSPHGDIVATACEDHAGRLWDAVTGKLIGPPMRHQDVVTSVGFSPDGQRLLTGSKDATVRVWEVDTGQALGEPMRSEFPIVSARFSPDGARVVAACYNKRARLWQAKTARLLGEPIHLQQRILSAEFSPDGLHFVTASLDQTARLWDGHTARPIGEPLRHHSGVWYAQFSPNGQSVLTASQDKTARVWDVRSGNPVGDSMLHPDQVRFGQFGADGQRVLTIARDHKARLWDIRSQPRNDPMRHAQAVVAAQFSPDGDKVVTISYDETARLWDARLGQPLGMPLRHRGLVHDVDFSSDSQRFVTVSADKTARLWDAASSLPLGVPMDHSSWVMTVRFSPDGQRVVTLSGDHAAHLWDAHTGQALGQPMRHQGQIFAVAFSPDGKWVVTASHDHTARLWDSRTGRPLGVPMVHDGPVLSVHFSPSSQRVVTGSADKTARFWAVPTGEALSKPMHHGEFRVIAAEFSPDGRRVVTISGSHAARLWDADTSLPLGEPMRHTAFLNSATFSPDGDRVLTASADHTARLWHAHTGQALGLPMRHQDAVNSARFSLDGKRVVTASNDNTARIWETPPVPTPIPSWVAHWAEAVAGARLTVNGSAETLSYREASEVLQTATGGREGFFGNAAKWFNTDLTMRTVSPWSPLLVSEYVRRRSDESSLESLREAVALSPTDGLISAKLALELVSQNPEINPDFRQEARLYAQLAIRWAPARAEPWRAVSEVHLADGNVEAALFAINKALELQPNHGLLNKTKQAIMNFSEK